jgi:hypothetical protein
MGRNKPITGDGWISLLTIGILLFGLMPIIGLIWILIKGWDNTPQLIKVLWILSLIALAYGIFSYVGSLVSEKAKEVDKSIKQSEIHVSASDWKIVPDGGDSISGTFYVKISVSNSSSKSHEVDVSSHAVVKTINPGKGSCEYSDCAYQLRGFDLHDPSGLSSYNINPHSTIAINMTGEYSAFWIDSTLASLRQLCVFAGVSEWILDPNASCYP